MAATVCSRTVQLYPLLIAAALLTACATVDNSAGVAPVSIDPATRGPVAGIGIQGNDIVSMSDRMMRDMLSSSVLAGRTTPPQVLIDGELFVNESSQVLNKNLITERLRVSLNNASRGRMVFVNREDIGAVMRERELKRNGQVDVATIGLTRATAGVDYQLRGRIMSQDSYSSTSGLKQRYNQVSFEMLDMERGTVAWSGLYEFANAAADDVVYR